MSTLFAFSAGPSPTGLERRDERLLVGRQRRCRIVAQPLGVRLLADGHDVRVRRAGVGESGRLIGREDRIGICRLNTLEHGGAGRDLVGRAHAAHVSGTEDALPADAPAA
jgi:hypothetical protein